MTFLSTFLRRRPFAGLAGGAAAMLIALASPQAQAVPSFARQTGMDCTGCHIGAFGPQLTPEGIRFKLGGYTDTDGKEGKVPVSAMLMASLTRTRADQNPPPEHLDANNNATLDEASLFLAGRLGDQLGAFVQGTYSGIDRSAALDQVDLRWARGVTLGGVESTVGITLNNNPSVQDPFNTLPAWSFPYVSPEAAFGTGDAASLLNGGLEGRVAGASAYALWDKHVYTELGTYRSLSSSAQDTIGLGPDSQRLGANTYWRLGWLSDLKSQNFSVGAYGWNAKLTPDREAGAPYDRYHDVGLDGSYQFLGTREHVATVNASALRERIDAGDGSGQSTLYESRLAASYNYRQTWGASLGLFDTHGSDPASATRGQVWQADWTPWGKEDATAPSPFSWTNLRLGLQWWHYNRFGGDTSGASDHDTLHLFAWAAF